MAMIPALTTPPTTLYVYPVGYTPDPAQPDLGALAAWDDATHTYTDYLDPTRTRPYTPEEITRATLRHTAAVRAAGVTDLADAARRALAVNAGFLALTTPTNAQAIAQLRALTRQANALIRLALTEPGDGTDT